MSFTATNYVNGCRLKGGMIHSLFYHSLSDDIYAYALSKALARVSAPATVGLYSDCQNRITRILKKIEGTFTL